MVSFLHRLRPLTARTKRGVPSSWQGVACTISPSRLALGRPRCARWSAGCVPKCTLARSPLVVQPPLGRPQRQPQALTPAVPETTVVAAARALSLAPGRRLRTRVAGGGLFLPWLARVHCAPLVSPASSPGATMVPATSALLSLLVLQLLDKERRSHIKDFNFDEAVGLCAGLHVPPKQSDATDYSYRTVRAHQQKLLAGWLGAVAPVVFPQANTCSLDFPPIPCRGDATGLDQPSLPRRGKAGTRVLSFCAPEHESQVVCDANAHRTRRDQAGEALQCVEFWQALTGVQPQWLYFASKGVPSPERSQLNQRGSWFVTIRRRGAAIRRRRSALPASQWRQAVLDTPHRRHPRIRYLAETVQLPGDKGARRHLAVTGRGRESPTLFLSTNAKESARALIVRYAGRKRVEDGLGISVHVFHVACLASAVRLHVDLDTTMTVLANGGSRWLAKQLRGVATAAPTQLYRTCVATGGVVDIQPERIVVPFDQRCHNPILREAALDQPRQAIPWLRNLPVVCQSP